MLRGNIVCCAETHLGKALAKFVVLTQNVVVISCGYVVPNLLF